LLGYLLAEDKVTGMGGTIRAIRAREGDDP